MNFSLKDLELHFGTSLFQEANDLIQYSFIDKISNVGNDTWMIRYPSEDLSPSCVVKKNQVKKYSCSCAAFNIYKKCKHVAALCIMVRKIKIKSELAHDEDYITSIERSKTTSVPKILEKTPSKDIIRFVSNYAKTDPDLALALKSRFIFNLNDMASVEDEILLSNAVKRLISSKRASESSFYKIINIIDGYYLQAEDKVLMNELIQAKNIFALILNNFAQIAAYSPSFGQKITDRSIQCFKKLQLIHSLLVAPAAKNEITEVVWEMLSSIEHVYDLEWHRSLRLTLTRITTDKDQVAKMMQDIVQKINATELSIDIRAIYIVFWLQLNQLTSKSKQIPLYEMFDVLDQDTIRGILADLISQHEMQIAGNIIELVRYQSEMYNSQFIEEIDLVALDIYTRTKDWSKAHKLVLSHFRIKPDLKILLFVQEHFPEKMDHLVEEIAEQAVGSSDIDIQTQAIIFVYKHNLQGLVDLITETRNLELLTNNDKIIWSSDPEKAKELYLLTTQDYLETYFGEPAQVYIQKVITQLFQKGHREFALDLKKILTKKFPKRSLFTFKPTFIVG